MRTLVTIALFSVVSVHAAVAAAEPLQFPLPAGWVADAAEAKSRGADLYAADTRTQPAVEMTGLHMASPMAADDAFVRGLVNGLKKSTPSLVEVKHDFVSFGALRVVRVIADVASDGEQYRQAYYVMPAGAVTAILLFTMSRAGFDARLPSLDAIARTTKGLSAAAGPASSR